MKRIMITLCAITLLACQSDGNRVTVSTFGKLADGRKADIYTITNHNGAMAKITNYGAIVVSLTMPDRSGRYDDIVLGYDSLRNYLDGNPYFGCIAGRYANRIGKGRFTLDGITYQLTINDGGNHLHGGLVGFDQVLWSAEPVIEDSAAGLKLTYHSPDGEQGYPGDLDATVVYLLTDDNELKIGYTAKTDKPTICNLTHHSYFNLSGNPATTILDHELMIDADAFTPVDKGLITTGEITPVAGTPMDFRQPKKIGRDINADYEQLKFAGGYDHNWVLNGYDGTFRKVCSLYDSASGRYLEILTDQPGLQFYSGNFLDGKRVGKKGIAYPFRSGLCLEAQKFPDSPNKPDFPSAVLRPGEIYRQTTVYRFSVK
jgi:aldose 1-epimerase